MYRSTMKAVKKYCDANYSNISIRIPKETAATIRAYAASKNVSLAKFLTRAALELIERAGE